MFTTHQNFGLVQIESICRQQNTCKLKTGTLFGMVRKHCGKRRKCWLPAFSSGHSHVFKGLFLKAV